MKTLSRVILSAILLALTGVLILTATRAPALVFSFYPDLSRRMIAVLTAATSPFPFALWEILALLAILWAVYTLVRGFARHHSLLRWLSGVLLAFSAALLLFVSVWGLGHFGPDVGDQMGLNVRKYTEDELLSAALYYTEQANDYAPQVGRDGDGVVTFSTFRVLAAQAGQCHELAHRLAFPAEDDANFCAYLACMSNPSPEFRYSGAYSAFLYCYNALYDAAPSKAALVWDMASPQLRADCHAASVHYEPYEGAVQDAAQAVNDAYLKAFQEEEGVKSYGAVADYLIAWYLKTVF